MKKHYETHVEDTDKLISVAGPVLDYKSWYEQYRKLMEEQAQRKYGLYTPTSEGDDDDFPSISGMIARYSASGLTNEQMATNPVWVDKTGNGHDIQLKNFSWKGMSGVGGYGDENHHEEITKEINTYDLTPGEALQVKDHYPEWVAGITVKVGERYLSDNVLWECIKEHTTQDNWKPSMATASLWKVVDEEHEGTIDDPIIYIPPMEIFKDKYYIQNGIKYKCTRNSEQPLTHDLSALVGLYVETI